MQYYYPYVMIQQPAPQNLVQPQYVQQDANQQAAELSKRELQALKVQFETATQNLTTTLGIHVLGSVETALQQARRWRTLFDLTAMAVTSEIVFHLANAYRFWAVQYGHPVAFGECVFADTLQRYADLRMM